MGAGELGRYGGDQAGDYPDDVREAQELPHHTYAQDLATDGLHERDIELQTKVFRGELRWHGDRWVESQPFDHVQLEDRARRMKDEVRLPDRVSGLPDARDAVPNIDAAQIDQRKFSHYSMNPQHPANGGKADGWRDLGYRVDDPDARQEAAADLCDLVKHHLLGEGKVGEVRLTDYARHYRVLNGFIGPNDMHATLVTCWRVDDSGETGYPKLITTWVQPHRQRERDQ